MLTYNRGNFVVDITPLFNLNFSKRAIDMSSDYVGGFDKLTDMCCHLAVMMIKCDDEVFIKEYIKSCLSQYMYCHEPLPIMYTVMEQYATVLRHNFVDVVVGDHIDYNALNHITVHGACHDYVDSNTTRRYISGEIMATVCWHAGEINVS